VTVLDTIKARRSISRMKPDAVPKDVIERMLDGATWAPNHRATEPWRFYVLQDEGKKRFAAIRRRVRSASFPDPNAPEAQKALDKVQADTLATPAIIAVTSYVCPNEEQRREDFAATYMAAQNLMLVGWDEGVGSYLRSGAILHDAELRELLNLEPDREVLGMVYVGYPADVPQKKRTPAADRTIWL
jgi:nitroreductase